MTEPEADAVSLPRERILLAIHVIRGHKVMLDADLAALYGVETKALNQAVKRNIARFPSDFMFRLTAEEAAASRSQLVTLNRALEVHDENGGQRATPRGANVKYLPYAFTEQGASDAGLPARQLGRSLRLLRFGCGVRELFRPTSRSCARSCGCDERWRAAKTWGGRPEAESRTRDQRAGQGDPRGAAGISDRSPA
jgi:hypothetical protein